MTIHQFSLLVKSSKRVENQTSIGTVTATDDDVGDTISYSINNAVEQRIEVSIAASEIDSGNVYVISGAESEC